MDQLHTFKPNMPCYPKKKKTCPALAAEKMTTLRLRFAYS